MFHPGAKRLVVLALPLLMSSWVGCSQDGGGTTSTSDTGAARPDGDAAVGAESSANRPPQVEISAPVQVHRGEMIELDASGSTDPDGDALTYAWSLKSAPSGSGSMLENAESANANIRAETSGTYAAEVVVSDGTASASETADVSVVNRSPEAVANAEENVRVGTAVNLVGTDSTDPDGNMLSYQWSFITKPSGSSATIEGTDQAMTTMTPDVAGDYALKVRVSDGEKSDSDRVTVSASSSTPGTTVYVRTSGDDTNPGTESAPVATLQKGMQIASNSAKIERVDLGASTFDASASFEVSKSLTLLGEGPGNTVLNAGNSTGFPLEDGGRLRLIDLAIVDGTPAVEVTDGSRLDANSWRCEGAGVCVDTSGTAEENALNLTDSTFVGAGDGVSVGLRLGAKALNATNMTIRDYTIGITTTAGDIRIDDSKIEDCRYGISQGSSSGVTLRVLESSLTGNDFGVSTDGAKEVTVVNSTLRDQAKYGLRLESGESATLRKTTIQKSGRSGVRVSGDIVVTLDGGEISNNGRGSPANVRDRAGIYFEDSSHLFDAKGGTEIYGHPQDNVVFEDQSSGTLVDMHVHDAAKAGVYLNTKGLVELEDGRYVENENGLYADGPSTVHIRRADFIQNAKSGVDYRATGTLDAEGLILRKNGRYQIRVSNSPNAVDLGTHSEAGSNIFEMASTSRFAIYDARPARGSATGTVIHAADNLYKNGNYSIWFYNTQSLDQKTFTGPTTWQNTSAGDQKAVFKIEHRNQRIEF